MLPSLLPSTHSLTASLPLIPSTDPPVGQERWEPVEGGFCSALDLVTYIRKNYGTFFSVGVAGYPEGHPNRISQVEGLEGLSEAERGRVAVEREEDGAVTGHFVCKDEDFAQEIEYLKQKVEAGADFVVSPLYIYENGDTNWVGFRGVGEGLTRTCLPHPFPTTSVSMLSSR